MSRCGVVLCLLGVGALLEFAQGASDLPLLPFGFYQYTVTAPEDKLNLEAEVVEGMNLVCPYLSTGKGHTEQEWENIMAFMDRAAQLGMVVNYALNAYANLGNDNTTLANIASEVNRLKDHPALLAWYLADEPDGQGIPVSSLQPKYDLIKKLDSKHPVGMVFCAGGAKNYLSALDLIMIDNYPIPNAPVTSVASALDAVADFGKPVMFVPQAFGGGENWARAPTSEEERVMTYLAFIHGATAVQYFIRSAPLVFPNSPLAWNECRRLAKETAEMAPHILAEGPHPEVNSSSPSVHTRAWRHADGSVLVIVANTDNSEPVEFSVALDPSTAAGLSPQGTELFKNRGKKLESGRVAETLRGFDTAAYLFLPNDAVPTTSVSSPNLIYNPSFEEQANVGTPDGFYVSEGADLGALYATDSRRAMDGRHSLRLLTPSTGNGVSLSPYTVHPPSQHGLFNFSFFAMADVVGLQIKLSFGDGWALVGNATVDVATSWTQYSATVNKTGECPSYGCRSWLSYQLTTPGQAWLDSMSLTPQ